MGNFIFQHLVTLSLEDFLSALHDFFILFKNIILSHSDVILDVNMTFTFMRFYFLAFSFLCILGCMRFYFYAFSFFCVFICMRFLVKFGFLTEIFFAKKVIRRFQTCQNVNFQSKKVVSENGNFNRQITFTWQNKIKFVNKNLVIILYAVIELMLTQ